MSDNTHTGFAKFAFSSFCVSNSLPLIRTLTQPSCRVQSSQMSVTQRRLLPVLPVVSLSDSVLWTSCFADFSVVESITRDVQLLHLKEVSRENFKCISWSVSFWFSCLSASGQTLSEGRRGELLIASLDTMKIA